MPSIDLLRDFESVLALFVGAGVEADVGWDDMQLKLRSGPRSCLPLLCNV
jgi:hypothetical protein